MRELENVIEQALVFADGDRVGVAALPAFLRGEAGEGKLDVPRGEVALPDILDDLEKQLILKAYEKAKGRQDRDRAPPRHQDQRALLQAREVWHHLTNF